MRSVMWLVGCADDGTEGRAGLTVIVVVANDHFLDQAVLAQLAPDVLIEGIKMHLHLWRTHLVLRVVGRVLVQVWEEDGLRVGRLDMLAGASVAVTACTDLVVETTIDLRVKMLAAKAKAVGEAVVPCLARFRKWRRGSLPCFRLI